MGWVILRFRYLKESMASATTGASVSAAKLWEATAPYGPGLAKWISLEWMTLSAGTAAMTWLLWRPQAPGYAMGVLALMAVLATFFAKPTQLQRVLMILLATGLFWLETSAIEQDHARAQAMTAATLRQILLEHGRAAERPSTDHGPKTQFNLNANGMKTKLVSRNDQSRFARSGNHSGDFLSHAMMSHQGGRNVELAFLSPDGSFDRSAEFNSDKDLGDGLSQTLPDVPTDGTFGFNSPTGGFSDGPFYNVAVPSAGTPPGLPEPTTWGEVILGLGILGIMFRYRRHGDLRIRNIPFGHASSTSTSPPTMQCPN